MICVKKVFEMKLFQAAYLQKGYRKYVRGWDQYKEGRSMFLSDSRLTQYIYIFNIFLCANLHNNLYSSKIVISEQIYISNNMHKGLGLAVIF